MNRRKSKHKEKLNIAMFGQKRIPSREGGVEIVVEELCTRMVALGHNVTCYNRGGHHVSGSEYDSKRLKEYKGIDYAKGITNSVASCTMYIELGRKLYMSAGSEKNLKLTTAEDIEIFKALLNAKKDVWMH